MIFSLRERFERSSVFILTSAASSRSCAVFSTLLQVYPRTRDLSKNRTRADAMRERKNAFHVRKRSGRHAYALGSAAALPEAIRSSGDGSFHAPHAVRPMRIMRANGRRAETRTQPARHEKKERCMRRRLKQGKKKRRDKRGKRSIRHRFFI